MVVRTVVTLALASLFALTTFADDAKLTTLGSEFQVNTYTLDNQRTPDVAILANGDFVVVWQSEDTTSGDPGLSIRGQRYASDGSALASEFQVNSYTTDSQRDPAIASVVSGGFIVAWWGAGSNDPLGIHGQRFASDGSAIGSEFMVNSFTTGGQSNPSIATDSSGSFVMVWSGQSATDSTYMDIEGQRYSSDGSTIGSNFLVNSYTSNIQNGPSVAVDGAGNFVVVWNSYGSPGDDSTAFSVQGQRFASSGSMVGTQFQINTLTTDYQLGAEVAASQDGSFVVVWNSSVSNGTDSNGPSIQGRRYASDGSALGAEFQVNTFTTSYQVDPAVDLDPLGNFTVTWQSGDDFFSDGPDGSNAGVQARRYASDGSAIGDEFSINSFTTDNQAISAISVDTNGDFVVVWQSDSSPGTDTSATSIHGQRFALEADVSITKTDGVTSADPGATVDYTIVVTNAGPDTSAPVFVDDTFPPELSCNWTSMATGGATGNTEIDSGNIADALAMPPGSMVTYTATCTIDVAASGTLSNTASATPVVNDPMLGNNIATDDDTVLTGQANLSVDITGPDRAELSAELVYTVTVENAGLLDATSIVLTHTLPAGTTFVSGIGTSWSCDETGGVVTCNRASMVAEAISQIEITLIASASEGALDNFVQVSASEADFDMLDNESAFQTLVVLPIFADGFESGNVSAWSNSVP